MASPLEQAGAIRQPSKSAPLHTNRFFTGLWTNRNPLRDAATPYLYEKFYSGTRFDSIIAGHNAEVTSRLTLAKRPGHSVYNNQNFPQVNRFYDFRIFSSTAEIIQVIADCALDVYDATGPNTKHSLFTKSAGAGPTYFQAVGNILYMANGVDQKKYVQSTKKWTPSTMFSAGDFIVDTNYNLQVNVGSISVSIQSFSITGNVATFVTSQPIPLTLLKSVRVTFSGFVTGVYFNAFSGTVSGTPSYNTFTMGFVHADVASTSESAALAATEGGNTDPFAQPVWLTTPGAVTAETHTQWICRGPAVQNWGIAAPTTAPNVVLAPKPSGYPAWAANTYYAASLIIVDPNNNLQKLTTAGQTGAVIPAVWSLVLGGTTADNTAVWTNIGPAGDIRAHAYAVGDVVAVSYSYYVTVIRTVHTRDFDATGTSIVRDVDTDTVTYPVTAFDFFTCTVAGISGASAPNWRTGTGTLVTDGAVTWKNTGAKKAWADIGANTLVSLANAVVGANGYLQNIQTSGKSGAVEPVWGTVLGVPIVDNTAVWINAGSFSSPNTADWIYSYGFKNSITNEISTSSPLSANIRLGAANMVSMQGAGSSDSQVDTIQIYRTAQGGSIQLLLDEIPAPAAGQLWSYTDTAPDSALSVLTQANRNDSADPPPAGAIALCRHVGRTWVAVGNALYFAGGKDTLNGSGDSAFPPANSFVFPSLITRLWPTPIGLLVFTVSDIYIILGRTAATFYDLPYLEHIGLPNYDALTVNGSTAYLFTNAKKVISLDPGAGVTDIGFAIADQFTANFQTAITQAAWHEQGSGDTALYIGDGLTGWHRMAPVGAPETGIAWSPKATIAAGCKALASIEVVPGDRRLLVGPGAGGGQILYRDATSHKDGAAQFSWDFVFGSIVLAQPGSMAEIEFITVDSVRTGSRPVLSTLLGEISGVFQNISWSRQDPVGLPASDSLYSERYYMAQNQQPTFCRHFQLQFAWPVEDAASELLSYTIFGAIHQEQD